MKRLSDSEGRNFLEKSEAGIYIEDIGLFSNEISKFLNHRGVDVNSFKRIGKYKHSADYLGETIAGMFWRVTSDRSNFPGRSVYGSDNSLGRYNGYPRMLFEMVDSEERNCRPAQMLDILSKEGSMRISELRDELGITSRKSVKKWGKNLKKQNLVRMDRLDIEPTKITKMIFSEDRLDTWNELKDWSYRIDVWD